jgi:multidrug efflux system membrane fusion protein
VSHDNPSAEERPGDERPAEDRPFQKQVPLAYQQTADHSRSELPLVFERQEVPQKKRTWRRWLIWAVALVLLGFGGLYLWRRTQTKNSQKAARGASTAAIHVVGAKAHKGDISVFVNGLGSAVPINTVNVTSRVDGQLMQVDYREGQMVKQGDRLAQIDPRPFEVTLTQAEGTLIRDQALLENARIDLSRYETLWSKNAIQEQQVATQRALVKQDEGNIRSDQGQIESSQLNITYSKITAPITGRVGLRLVDTGNLVSANSSIIAVITQLQPISVIFTIGEDQLPAVRARMRAAAPLPVAAFDRAMKTRLTQGSLETVDNQIDPTTGTVRLRATFENKNTELFPQQFVNAQMLLQLKRGVTLIPNAAIQRNGTKTYVWIAGPDQTAHVRDIAVGTAGPSESEITSGLTPGDVVITDGVDHVTEGEKVAVEISSAAVKAGA